MKNKTAETIFSTEDLEKEIDNYNKQVKKAKAWVPQLTPSINILKATLKERQRCKLEVEKVLDEYRKRMITYNGHLTIEDIEELKKRLGIGTKEVRGEE